VADQGQMTLGDLRPTADHDGMAKHIIVGCDSTSVDRVTEQRAMPVVVIRAPQQREGT